MCLCSKSTLVGRVTSPEIHRLSDLYKLTLKLAMVDATNLNLETFHFKKARK